MVPLHQEEPLAQSTIIFKLFKFFIFRKRVFYKFNITTSSIFKPFYALNRLDLKQHFSKLPSIISSISRSILSESLGHCQNLNSIVKIRIMRHENHNTNISTNFLLTSNRRSWQLDQQKTSIQQRQNQRSKLAQSHNQKDRYLCQSHTMTMIIIGKMHPKFSSQSSNFKETISAVIGNLFTVPQFHRFQNIFFCHFTKINF